MPLAACEPTSLVQEMQMPTYMTSFDYTHEGWQKLAKNPEDRSAPVKALMEKLGGRLVSMYYMAGDHDGFIIYEAPDAKVAATAIVAAGLAGHIRTLKTSQLYTVQEAMEVMGNAGRLAYPAPKG
jgi:uncharacterized protein with GYD domain